jgi:hypothetical protein
MRARSSLVPLVIAAFCLPAAAQTTDNIQGASPQASSPLSARGPSSDALRPRWVVFDFATGIKTIELADGSLHEELFEAEPIAQLALSTVPHAHALIDPVVTGSVPAPR